MFFFLIKKTEINVGTGVYQYSCAASCIAGTVGGVTTSCCNLNNNCNTVYKLSSCYDGTDNAATVTSCTNSGFCKVNIFSFSFFDFHKERSSFLKEINNFRLI